MLLFILCPLTAYSQTSYTDLSGPWLGQKTPGIEAIPFAHGVIENESNIFNTAFTPDGNEFYFTRAENDTYTIFVMRRINNRWTKPEIAPFSGKYMDCDMYVSHDGYRMFYSSDRPFPGTENTREALFIWYMIREKDGWGEPQFAGIPINTGVRALYPTMTHDGKLYFQSDRVTNVGGSEDGGDIYRALFKNGSYSIVEHLDTTVNSKYPELDNTIAPDESYLIVSTKRPDSKGGSDLYISFRRENGTWTEMINMGDKINTAESGEGCPMISHDGKYLFFIRRSGNYWISTEIIDIIKKEYFQ